MQSFDVSRVRRIVGVVEAGESFVDKIQELAFDRGVSSAWVSAVGHFAAADLQSYDPSARRLGPARVVTNADVVHLSGSIALQDGMPYFDAYAVLSHQGQTSAGRLRGARALLVEFVIEAFEGVGLERSVEPSSGLAAWHSSSPSPSVQAAPSGWAMAAAISETARAAQSASVVRRPLSIATEPAFIPPPIPERKRETSKVTDELDEPIPQVGEWVSHKQFGLCQVEGEEESGGGIVVRLPSGVRKSLHLDYLRVLAPTHDGGRTIYALEPRRR